MATEKYVALLGDFSAERVDLRSIAAEFGWSLRCLNELARLAEPAVESVMIHAKTLDRPWNEVVDAIHQALPNARCVVCLGLDETSSQEEPAAPGIFQTLKLPLNQCEVRQALGFVWAAARKGVGEETQGRAAARKVERTVTNRRAAKVNG
jgi:hypothetical protein